MIGDILQPTHLIFIFVVALLVLGPKRLPEVGRSLGKGLRDFRGAMAGIEEHASTVFNEPQSSSTSAPEFDPVVQTIAVEPAEETVLVNTASTPASSTVTAPVVSRRASAHLTSSDEPDPADYAD